MSSLILSACATPVLDLSSVDKNLTYAAARNSFSVFKDKNALWGGTLLAGTNLKQTTELEILAYPLDDYAEQIKNSNSFGRFKAIYKGYLELGEYSKDRRVTVVGRLVSLEKGMVGESEYLYPVLLIEQIKLWPIETTTIYDDSGLRYNFGIGIFHH